MNTPSHQNFEHSLQQLHGSALESLSADTLARLRHARRHAREARPVSVWGKRGWWLATACSAVLAVAAALNFTSIPSPEVAPSGTQILVTTFPYDDDSLLFEESPELYLWLGSDNALAME